MNLNMRRKRWNITRNCLIGLSMLMIVAGCGGQTQSTLDREDQQSKPEQKKLEAVSEKMAYWNEQRKGTNFMNSVSLPDNYSAAKEEGIEFIRLAPDKWVKERDFFFADQPDSKPERDFLIGSANQYEGINEEDFQKLLADLDAADERGMKVMLTVLSLPGDRWRQFYGNKNDDRIWKSLDYHKQAAMFWKDLANRLKDHPAVIGYNLINEPHPETATRFNDFWTQDYDEWYKQVENTPADLNLLYDTIVKAIRSVDKATPIIVDSGLYATPWAFKYLKPIDDPNVLYAFHMYEPYELTSQNRRKGFTYSYPGKVKVGNDQQEKMFDRTAIKEFLEPVAKWSAKYGVPANWIIASEFGTNRMVKGADRYMEDLISIFNEYGWHWAFYAFREDTWDGMDYELGDKKPDWKYWEAIESGKLPVRVPSDNPIWMSIKNGLKQ